MRQFISKIQKEECRESIHLSENVKTTFSNCSFMQTYHPGMDMFNIPESTPKNKSEFPSLYTISEWSDPIQKRIWKAVRTNTSNTNKEECNVFVKTTHLLDPIRLIREEYSCPEHPLLPQGERAWKTTLQKLHSQNNQAYIDATINYILSRFREADLTPHCVLYYGAYTGISNTYNYCISGEYASYRQCRWFWKGMHIHGAILHVMKDNENIDKDSEFSEKYNSMFGCPYGSFSSMVDLHPSREEICDADNISIHSYTFDDIDALTHTDIPPLDIPINEVLGGTLSTISGNSTDTRKPIDLNIDNSSEDTEYDISIELPNMPIIMIMQEAQEGTMDELLELKTIEGYLRGTKGWTLLWTAWLWQTMAALAFLQKAICFTHNDLHTNNIVWRKTDKKYLFYGTKDGTRWRVPTFGRIFSIIDFGRSICRIRKTLLISDDHWPEHDADGQYNFGPFFDNKNPRVNPNPSFDLCRLAVSMIDGLFDKCPARKRGSSQYLSEEDSWKVKETVNQLYNLLWTWTLDDSGSTVYENKHGEEKYPGFELYIQIAKNVHGCEPYEQLRKPIFDRYKYNGKPKQGETVYYI